MNNRILHIMFFALFTGAVLNAQVYFRTTRLPWNNSVSSEMAPAIYKNGVVFSSNKKDDVVLVTVDQDGGYMYNLYFSEKKGRKNWGISQPFAEELENRFNQSSVCFSADWNAMYYTATRGGTGKAGDMLKGDTLTNGIFITTQNNGQWSTPEEFPYNSSDYDVGYPSISADGSRLYFASNKEGGFGKYDIYYSDLKNGRWTKPVNMGPVINTEASEVFPFIFSGTRLYFSSAGHEGQGGLDIFYSDSTTAWQPPENLPRPFNSRYDDFAFVGNAELDTGYFATNRRGTDDIYGFASTFPAFTSCPEQEEESFCYEFYESGSMDLDTTSLAYEWDFGDGTTVRNTRASHCFKEPGYYLVQMNVIDTLTGDVYFSEASYDLSIEPVEQPYMLKPDTATVNQNISLDASQSTIRSFSPENYFWDLGDGTIESETLIKHRYTKEGIYTIRLGITGSSPNEPGKVQKACATKDIVVIPRR